MKSTIRRIPNPLLCLGICVMIVGTVFSMACKPVPDGRGGVMQRTASSYISSPSEYIRVSDPVAEAVTYLKDIRPILGTSCVSCHGPKKQKAGFRADHRDDLFRKTGKRPLVRPGDSGESRLVAIVSGTTKIKRNAKDHILSPGEVALIKAWIDAGAR